MSLNDITRYVRQTPGNTNPSVVASMVNAEMNSTLEEAKKYTDSQRLGYKETKTTTILPETALELFDYEDMNIALVRPQIPIQSDDIITVVWDEKKYVCARNEFGGYGNAALAGGELDTGEPFLISESDGSGSWIVLPIDGQSHNISIFGTEMVIKQIDDEYIPEQIPFIELETFKIGYGGIVMSNADSQKILSIKDKNAFIANVVFEAGSFTVNGDWALFIRQDDTFYAVVDGIQIQKLYKFFVSIHLGSNSVSYTVDWYEIPATKMTT